jgi:hypothetical protein
MVDDAAMPAFKDCLAAASGGQGLGIVAIGAPPERLKKDCPEIAEILASSAVRTSLETYQRRNAEAKRQQVHLMQEATRANVCLLAAGVLSGLVLLLGAQKDDLARHRYAVDGAIFALGILTLALGAAGAYFQYIARDQGRISRWRAARGEAEIARLDVFTALATEAAARSPAVALYGFAILIAHLVNDQRSWFEKRALSHRQSSELTSMLGGLANALTFVGGGGALIASQTSGSYWIVFAGVIGAAIAAYSANRDALLRDRANADRYEKTQVALDGLAGRTDAVARQIAGEPKAIVAFAGAVTDLLSTEHKQWLDGTQQAEALLEKLDAQLRQLRGANKP